MGDWVIIDASFDGDDAMSVRMRNRAWAPALPDDLVTAVAARFWDALPDAICFELIAAWPLCPVLLHLDEPDTDAPTTTPCEWLRGHPGPHTWEIPHVENPAAP